jgi:hypothetical protein
VRFCEDLPCGGEGKSVCTDQKRQLRTYYVYKPTRPEGISACMTRNVAAYARGRCDDVVALSGSCRSTPRGPRVRMGAGLEPDGE